MGPLTVDPERVDLAETGIFVRAMYLGTWGSHDIAHLDRASLLQWLRSRGEKNEWAEGVLLHLLGHEGVGHARAQKAGTCELARDALAVQDACNLSGVAHGFARAMSALCALDLDTDARNRHPIAIVWADKIAHLTGTQTLGHDVVMRAFDEVHKLAASKGGSSDEATP